MKNNVIVVRDLGAVVKVENGIPVLTAEGLRTKIEIAGLAKELGRRGLSIALVFVNIKEEDGAYRIDHKSIDSFLRSEFSQFVGVTTEQEIVDTAKREGADIARAIRISAQEKVKSAEGNWEVVFVDSVKNWVNKIVRIIKETAEKVIFSGIHSLAKDGLQNSLWECVAIASCAGDSARDEVIRYIMERAEALMNAGVITEEQAEEMKKIEKKGAGYSVPPVVVDQMKLKETAEVSA